MRVLKRIAQVAAVLLGILLVAGCATGLWFWSELRGSLPRTEGRAEVAGPSAEVRIERDKLGVPRIQARNEADAVFALGWLHGQERFFQMDLMRRRAAGELSEVVGPATVEMDKASRIHRFRWRAGRVVAALPADDRALLTAYTAGVNAGLAALRAKPIEYVMLRTEPAPWRPEDSVLVVYNMFFELQDDTGSNETMIGALHRYLPPGLAGFLDVHGTEWDAPVVGDAMPGPPLPMGLDFSPGVPSASNDLAVDEPAVGSNNWVVSGAHTADGHAWVANDMHLGLQLPNTWYRASLQWREPSAVSVTGVTLPGGPGVVVGSNGHVAWGFTNSYGDWSDVVLVRVQGARPGNYRRLNGEELPFDRHMEVIAVKGQAPIQYEVRETVWGPIVGAEPEGDLRALRWTAHDAEALNLELFHMADARTLDDALRVAALSGIPAQNLVAADAQGHIGWTICGRIPLRVGFSLATEWWVDVAGPRGAMAVPGTFSPDVPHRWGDPPWGAHWDGYLDPARYPRIVDPPSGRIWTANNRVVDGPMLAVIGDGGFALGARAKQIRDDLMALEHATPQDLLHVQLDDRAVFLERWQTFLLDQLTPQAAEGHPLRAEARGLVERWGGHASVDSVGFRIVRGFRSTVSRDVWRSLTGPCRVDKTFGGPHWQFEGPLWEILHRSPNWNAFLLDALDRTLADMTKDGTPLAKATWGKRNTVRVGHPLAQGMPSLARWLDMPALELPGADHMPRVQSPTDGASERMVVSPGQEEKSLFHMPGGQSGHPSSPHYGDGHLAWAKGEPTPFLPGPAVDVLTLVPTK